MVIIPLSLDFHITECTVKYCGLENSRDNQYDVTELIITNYEPPTEISLYN